MRSSPQHPAPTTKEFAREVAEEAEPLVRVWDRAEDWVVPRIPPTQVKVLNLLRDRGSMNLSVLAAAVGAIPSSASRLCDRLEASGLVRREVPANNRRAIQIILTGQGRRRLKDFDLARRDDFRVVLDLMDARAREGLLDGLRAFSEAAQSADEASA